LYAHPVFDLCTLSVIEGKSDAMKVVTRLFLKGGMRGYDTGSEEKHFIQFIDCYQNGRYLGRALLSAGIYPAACFHLKEPIGKVTITEHCNVHGYWKTEIDL
jgi:desulfoferrodoxin (superoxide reductase-like protein)